MSDQEYSKREIDTLMDHIKESLERIEQQTTKTNGRVTVLEKLIWTAMGAIAVILAIISPNITSIIKVLAGN